MQNFVVNLTWINLKMRSSKKRTGSNVTPLEEVCLVYDFIYVCFWPILFGKVCSLLVWMTVLEVYPRSMKWIWTNNALPHFIDLPSTFWPMHKITGSLTCHVWHRKKIKVASKCGTRYIWMINLIIKKLIMDRSVIFRHHRPHANKLLDLRI